MPYSLELVLPDIDWSVHNSPDQSESKNKEKGLTLTGAQSDFCLLMFLFQITWYFKIFCLKAYKFLAKNGIYFDHVCLFTLSPSLSVNG